MLKKLGSGIGQVKSKWAVIALIIAFVTFLKITQTYGDFWKEAFDAWEWVLALYAVTLGLGIIVIFFVIKTVKPQDPFPTAVVIAIGLLAYFATPIATQTFVGSDLAGQPESVKLSDLYAPWDKFVSGEIDKPVSATKSEEIEKVVQTYRLKGKAGKERLLDRLSAGLAAVSKTTEEKAKIERNVEKILRDTKRKYPRRLRDVAQALYAEGLRGVVRRLGRLPS